MCVFLSDFTEVSRGLEYRELRWFPVDVQTVLYSCVLVFKLSWHFHTFLSTQLRFLCVHFHCWCHSGRSGRPGALLLRLTPGFGGPSVQFRSSAMNSRALISNFFKKNVSFTKLSEIIHIYLIIYNFVMYYIIISSPFQSGRCGILPLLKHACGESNWLLCWPYTPANVSLQRWISGKIYHIHLHQGWIRWLTRALKPRGDVTRSPNQGYQWPQKWTCTQQNFF